MNVSIYNNLKNNRMLKNDAEIKQYEHGLELLSSNFSEDDIIDLCLAFDDNTNNHEVMFGAIHLLETLSSELAYINTIIGVVNMFSTSPMWAKTILYRILNDEASVQMIKRINSRLENKTYENFKLILEQIKAEDCDKFGNIIDELISSSSK